jgi:lipopolysaccharide transport system ATP-binding protein
MPEPLISFDGVWKKFRRGEHHDSLRDLIPALARKLTGRSQSRTETAADEFWVLRDVSFEVRSGHTLGIIGQNGAGKSTALKLLTRIMKPTKGVAQVRGRVGALIELAAGFHPDLTGRENIFLQGAIMGMSREEIRKRFDDIVSFSGISEFIDTPVKRYSSGMNARLGFAIAANLDPEVLLIDEVLAVGDFNFQQRCFERLEQFRRNGIAIAFVSHNMQAVASLCDRVMLLTAGQPPILGDVPTVLAQYVASRGSVADPRITNSRATLRRSDTGAEVTSPVSPSAVLQLEVELIAGASFPRCGVLLQVVRSDGLVIFTGMSTLDGLAEIDLNAGDHLSARIAFAANVLKGTYVVNLQLVDTMRQWPPAIITGVASFVVTETTRVAGCAELLPSYDLSVTRGTAQVGLGVPMLS